MEWAQEYSEAFSWAKEELASTRVLTHYDPKLPLNMAADTSVYGMGAVLSHVFPDGTERPVAFASHTLFPSEKNYTQVGKEALSDFWGEEVPPIPVAIQLSLAPRKPSPL